MRRLVLYLRGHGQYLILSVSELLLTGIVLPFISSKEDSRSSNGVARGSRASLGSSSSGGVLAFVDFRLELVEPVSSSYARLFPVEDMSKDGRQRLFLARQIRRLGFISTKGQVAVILPIYVSGAYQNALCMGCTQEELAAWAGQASAPPLPLMAGSFA